MRTIIAGSRGITDPLIVSDAIDKSGFEITTVISGGARGVDEAGEAWAVASGIDLEIFEADWKAHGKKAGFLRNCEMAASADALIAIWDGESRGTKHMIDEATRKGLKVFVKKL